MTLRYEMVLFVANRFEDHDIQSDRAELLSVSI